MLFLLLCAAIVHSILIHKVRQGSLKIKKLEKTIKHYIQKYERGTETKE